MAKIQDYGIIGNGRSAALISHEGSIDWLCWPRFDSPSIFAAIIDEKKGGSWRISPTEKFQASRQYIDRTNVLQTEFMTDSGMITLTDFIPVFSEKEKEGSLQPEQELIRRVECFKGTVEIQIVFDPRPNYGKDKVKLREAFHLGLRLEIGSQLITLRGDIRLVQNGDGARAKVVLKKGENLNFSLSYSREGPAVIPPLMNEITHKLDATVKWWQKWSDKMTYNGPYKDFVQRSALVLKLLGYAPSGAFIAAPTTSLPYNIKKRLNWGDYRYCWLRDSAFMVRALFRLGYFEEAAAFTSWLLHSTRLAFPKLKVLYDVYGREIRNSSLLKNLSGFAKSRPKIYNSIRNLFELDVYGEVIESVTFLVRAGGKLDNETQKMLRGFGKAVCKNWQKADTGIWEKTSPTHHYTHSKLMCWVALDRLLELHELGMIKKIPREKFRKNLRLIQREIEEKGWNSTLQSYTQYFEGTDLDATSLVMSTYGFSDPGSRKMQRTYQKIQEKLSAASGLLYRYEKSRREGEGAFGLCSFWRAEFLAQGGGSIEEGHQAIQSILPFSNDLGLFGEQIDPNNGDVLGNFPQAFTHVGLINAALTLEDREKRGKS